MSDYSITTDFSVKDGLTTGDPEKIILGADFDVEFDAISTAIASKYDVNDLATQAQAEAGSNNTTLMTPLRVNQAVLNGVTTESLVIQDSGATDNLTAAHDGTDINVNFTNTAAVNFFDGIALEIYDSTNTDLMSLRHDGSDFLTTFTTTSSWSISGAAQAQFLGGMDLVLRDAGQLIIQDAADASSATFEHTGPNFNASFSNTTNWNISGAAAMQLTGSLDLRLRDGARFTIYNSSDTDWMQFWHDGTDVNFDFNGTSDVNLLKGVQLKVWDAADTDYTELKHTGTNAQLTTNTGQLQFLAPSIVSVITGNSFRVYDSGDTNYIQLTHDGTDAQISTNSGFLDFGDESVATDVASAGEVGFRGIPYNTQNGNYTLVLDDAGRMIRKNSGGAGETITIPANSSVAFPIGTAIAISNNGGGDLTIAITTDTLIWSGGLGTGTRTLPDDSVAVIIKIGTTTWMISGSGLS